MNIIEYIGRFHPLAVHVPIGIVCVFLVMAVFIPRSTLQKADSMLKLILLVGALSATASSISGYLISSYGAYDVDMVTQHQVLGIGLTLYNWFLVFGLGFLMRCNINLYRIILTAFLFLVIATGHLGGSLTHGSDFLNPPPFNQWFSTEPNEEKVITIESKAFDVTSKIFSEKCLVCHGKNKQKGKLRLDTRKGVEQGGEEGPLIGSSAEASLLVQRLMLPVDDEDHMPPKEKKQLSKKEINFLTWWIESGASFDQTLSELSFPDSLHSLIASDQPVATNNLIPIDNVLKADEKVIEQIMKLGVVVTPIGQNSNYLSVSFVNVLPENTDKAAADIATLAPQLIWLNLDYQKLSATSWEMIGFLTNLRKLSVKESNLNDKHIAELSTLAQLVGINLVSTDVTYTGLESIGKLNNVKSISLFQTSILGSDFTRVKRLFPGARIDTGNYKVPTFESDTTVLTKQ